MAKTNNLTDFLTDVANAIREKKGTTDLINPQDFSAEIASIETGGEGVTINNQDKVVDIVENGSTEVVADAGFTGLGKVSVNVNVPSSGGGDTPSRPKWTGHADAEGLKAIGWTDEDIAYYQEHGVNWNAEDDEYHKVTDDNKALYGVLTVSNISSYKTRIVYLPYINTGSKSGLDGVFKDCRSMVAIPKLNTSKTTSMYGIFEGCTSLVSVPALDTSKTFDFRRMFYNCYSLVSIPQLDTQSVTRMDNMFYNCYSLVNIPKLDTSNVTNMYGMFQNCYSLVSIPQLDTSNVTSMGQMFENCRSLISIPQLDTSNMTDMYNMFYSCFSLVSIPQLDTQSVTNMYGMFGGCLSLVSISQLDTSSVTSMGNMFGNCNSLSSVNLKNAKLACDLSYAELLSKDSLLCLINNEAATSAITIKLALYAYTRLAEDADIVAALANHPNISIAQ